MANSGPPFLAPKQVVGRFRSTVFRTRISQRFVWPEMEAIANAEFIGQPFNSLERVDCVGLPLFTSGENFGTEDDRTKSLSFDPRYVFGADVDRFVEDGDRFEFRHGGECG